MSLIFANDLCSAFTTAVVRSFQKQQLSGYLGRTALQKLVYFSKAIGVPIPCSFEIYNFGPYSEDISTSVSKLLADEAIEDASLLPAKYSSYKLGPSSEAFSPTLMKIVDTHMHAIDAVVSALGSSNPATLELVATLHFVNAEMKGILGKRPSRAEVEKRFKSIKGEKFSASQIQTWYGWLDSTSLL